MPRKSTASTTTPASEGPPPNLTTTTEDPPSATKDKDKEANLTTIEDLSLPRTMTTRLSKGVLPPNTQIHRDAILALSRAATVFVSHLAAASNANTTASGRRTISPGDVLLGVRECEFWERMGGRLEGELKRYGEVQAGKRNEYRRKVRESGGGKEGGGSIKDKDKEKDKDGESNANVSAKSNGIGDPSANIQVVVDSELDRAAKRRKVGRTSEDSFATANEELDTSTPTNTTANSRANGNGKQTAGKGEREDSVSDGEEEEEEEEEQQAAEGLGEGEDEEDDVGDEISESEGESEEGRVSEEDEEDRLEEMEVDRREDGSSEDGDSEDD
ncbi:hypothetical protein MMC09_001305 [Bachmanniomyces sp. S44760]|nr:hypothetical protein [Bachmanniomyces sp. S44760]